MKVWRVFNGWMGFCAVHRIVVAATEGNAILAAETAGMKKGNLSAVYVCESTGNSVEGEDWDG